MDMKNIKTEDLIKELNNRKRKEVPELVKQLNSLLDVLKGYNIKIKNINDDCYYIEEFELEMEDDEIRINFIEEEV